MADKKSYKKKKKKKRILRNKCNHWEKKIDDKSTKNPNRDKKKLFSID